ncbi:MAG: methyltransferase domain-containing protein [Polyangiales bacterium]
MEPARIAPGIELHYGCALAQLPADLAARFVGLEHDSEARAFVSRALSAPHGRLQTAAYRLLRRALSDYDAYGLLRMYPMHLLSAAQLATLLGTTSLPRPRRLLDVGAGNGDLTAAAAPLFDEVLVTEASRVMRRRLRARGLRVLMLDLAREPPPSELRVQAALCLNVLDRCSHPRSLLRHLRMTLAPSGLLLLSVPVPLSPHVQRGASTVAPEEPLPAPGPSFEASVTSIAAELLAPAGLRVQRLSRVPYLCHGDADMPIYALDAAIFVCVAEPLIP